MQSLRPRRAAVDFVSQANAPERRLLYTLMQRSVPVPGSGRINTKGDTRPSRALIARADDAAEARHSRDRPGKYGKLKNNNHNNADYAFGFQAMTLLDLDIRTTMRLLLIGNMAATVLLIAYKQHREQKRSIGIFVLAKVFQSIAWLLLSLRGEISLLLSAHLGNLLLLIGFSLEMTAFSRLTKVRRPLELAFAAVTACASILVWIFPDPSLWVAIASIATIGIYAPTAVVLLVPKNASRLQVMIGAFFLVSCAAHVVRAHSAFAHGLALLSTTAIQSLTFLSAFGLTLIGGLGFLLLMNEDLEKELIAAATVDSLTGILNRRAFFANAEIALNLALRNATPVTLLMIDIDRFKNVNDTYGHAVGDTVLASFAKNVRLHIRPHDVFGRIGGEEFAVLMIDSEAGGLHVAERIRATTEKLHAGLPAGLSYTVSIGAVTCIPQSVAELTSLLQLSDEALYQAKNDGRNRVRISHPIPGDTAPAQDTAA